MPSQNNTYKVKLGAAITNYYMDGTRLFISGDALSEGVWQGVDGIPRFFPRAVIRAAAPLFNNVPLVCEHRGLKIGDIVNVEPTELGFRIVEGYVTDPTSIEAVMSGRKTGYSIEGLVIVDPVTSIIEAIVSADNVSLVADPACRVCGIDHTQFIGQGENIMNSEKITNSAPTPTDSNEVIETDSNIEVSVDAVGDVAEVVHDDLIEHKGFIEELKTTAQKFVDICKKITGAKEVSLSETDVEESVTEPPIIVNEPIEPIEVIEFVEETVEEVQTPSETIELSNGLNDAARRIELLESALSKAVETITQYGAQIEALTTAVQTLEAEKVKLSAVEHEVCAELIGKIKELDPDTDDEFVSGMSSIQLARYKEKIETLSKPIIGGMKTSVPRNVAPPVKSNSNSREAAVHKIAKYLKKQEY